jgi:ABC-type ATPase involved in cell division
MAVVMATHDLDLVRAFPQIRVIELDQGRLVYDSGAEQAAPAIGGVS